MKWNTGHWTALTPFWLSAGVIFVVFWTVRGKEGGSLSFQTKSKKKNAFYIYVCMLMIVFLWRSTCISTCRYLIYASVPNYETCASIWIYWYFCAHTIHTHTHTHTRTQMIFFFTVWLDTLFKGEVSPNNNVDWVRKKAILQTQL